MAVAELNPLISAISGRMGNLVFYIRQNRQCIRSYVLPRNPDTDAQRIIRRTFADAVKSWQAMTRDEKYIFTRKARGLQMSGYNLYISEYMTKKIKDAKESSSAIYPFRYVRIFPSVSAPDIIRSIRINAHTPVQHNTG